MNPLGYLLIFCLLLLACVCAAGWRNTNVWRWCPKCRRYHSELGITAKRPSKGVISTVPEKCNVCR